MDRPEEEIKTEAAKVQKWYKETYQKELGFAIEYSIDKQTWEFLYWYDNPRKYFPYFLTAKVVYSDFYADVLRDMFSCVTRAIRNEMEMNVNPSNRT